MTRKTYLLLNIFILINLCKHSYANESALSTHPTQEKALLEYNGISPQLFHQIGRNFKNSWIVSAYNGDRGRFLNYGPYVTLPEGDKKVTFWLSRQDLPLQVQNGSVRLEDMNSKVLTLEVYESSTKKVITQADIWEDDLNDNWQNFSLIFSPKPNTKYEFRSFWHGGSGVRLHKIEVHPSHNRPDESVLTMPLPQGKPILEYNGISPQLLHQIGRNLKNSWIVSAYNGDRGKFLNYGPYVSLPEGEKRVTFWLSRQDLPLQVQNGSVRLENMKSKVLTLEVYESSTNKVVTQLDVWEEELNDNWQHFSLIFSPNPNATYEFRSFWHGGSGVRLHKIEVHPANYGKIGDLWSPNAKFVKTAGKIPGGGWHVVHDGKWYYYSRGPASLPKSLACQLRISVAVSVSTDKGVTWSAPKDAVVPSGIRGDEDACAILDGNIFFDSVKSLWKIFAQCQGDSNMKWQMCLYESQSLEGPFIRNKKGTVKQRQLWSQICNYGGKSCDPNIVYDEGTPEYLGKKHGYFYFSFHGYDGVGGYRGAARTRNFSTWEVRGPSLPNDAYFTAKDCDPWNPGCVGAGHAASLRSGDFLYQIWEGPTRNIACMDDQNFVFGLSRSYKLERSGNWEHYPQNPYISPPPQNKGQKGIGCQLGYARFLVDGDSVYLYFTHHSRNPSTKKVERGTEVMKLIWSESESPAVKYIQDPKK